MAKFNKLILGVNDIGSQRPDLIKYFYNHEDIYKYTVYTRKKAKFICPVCGAIHEKIVADVSRYGISCCSDNLSYPNKFMTGLLNQLNIEFITEKTFNWSDRKRYDHYIPSLNLIIENHGEQHYHKAFDTLSENTRTLEEEQENDKYKENLAICNGIEHYVVIDARNSDMNYIKKSILNSELSTIFDLSLIDWINCHEYACDSLVLKVCEVWRTNKDMMSSEIGKLLKLDKHTVIKYLKHGSYLGLCDYSEAEIVDRLNRSRKNINGKKIRVIETGDIFESAHELANQSLIFYGEKFDYSLISKVCRGERNHHKGYTFEYVEKENTYGNKNTTIAS